MRSEKHGHLSSLMLNKPHAGCCLEALMNAFRVFLLASTALIYAMTVLATSSSGINWPAVALKDLAALDWRSQFDTDFLVYLSLGATWVAWREGFTSKGYVFAFLSIFLGGMFTFPYLLLATYQANGNPQLMLLGVHAKDNNSAGNDV